MILPTDKLSELPCEVGYLPSLIIKKRSNYRLRFFIYLEKALDFALSSSIII